MKTLKFDQKLVPLITKGAKTSTWRLFDEKNITVDDEVEFINKQTSEAFGVAKVNQVIITRLGDIRNQEKEGHEEFQNPKEMYTTFTTYYGQKVGPKTPVKIINFTFRAYDAPVKRKITDERASLRLPEVKVFADGGSRGNPGPSASGVVIKDMADNVVKKESIYLGITTNNQAEYHALKLGLLEAKLLGARKVEMYMDSLLVINQMKGIFKVKNRDLWPVHASIKELVNDFEKVTFTHVPRELNKLADAAVNEMLDKTANNENMV